MFNRISQSFVAVATKFYSNVLIQPVDYRCIVPQLKSSLLVHRVKARGYSDDNLSNRITRQYDKLYEEKLNKLLEEPQYKAMYDKYNLEIEYLGNITSRIPKTLKAANWLHLLETTKKGQRRSYLEFLWKLEKKDENREKKKALQQKLKEETAMENQQDDNPYGLNKCTLFFRIRDTAINHFYNSRLISAILYEPNVVFDLGYEKYMTPFEQQNCARQLLLSFSMNRIHDNPFNLHFCNVNKDGIIMHKLHRSIPSLYNPEFPLNITTKSYLDVFDKEKLIYLTPHTNDVMTKFDPKLVYIIGGMVDKINPKPISFQKARREGIRMMRLPLSEKLQWGTGSTKNLPLNQVLSILLDLRHTNDWDAALQHVPKRKLKMARLRNMERQIALRQQRIAYLANEK